MMWVICGKPDPADPAISSCGRAPKHEDSCGEWCFDVKRLKAALDVTRAECNKLADSIKQLGGIAGRVTIVTCMKCRQEYPQFSDLSDMTCPDCWMEKIAFSLEIADRDLGVHNSLETSKARS